MSEDNVPFNSEEKYQFLMNWLKGKNLGNDDECRHDFLRACYLAVSADPLLDQRHRSHDSENRHEQRRDTDR